MSGSSRCGAFAALVLLFTACVPEPGVVAGDGVVEWTRHYGGNRVITTLTAGRVHEDPSAQLCAGGDDGLVWLDANGVVVDQVRVRVWMGRPVPVDVDGDGAFEIVDRGHGWSDVGVYGGDGAVHWEFSPGDAPNDLCAADLDGDGVVEFLCGLNGAGGVVRLNDHGSPVGRWKATNVFTVEAIDADGDGRLEVLHSATGKGLVLRRSDGTRVRSVSEHEGHFCLTRWPDVSAGELIAVTTGDALDLIDLDGRLQRSLELPVGGFHVHRALSVRLKAGNATWLAAVRTYKATEHRSVFLLWRPGGDLAYAEVFPWSRLDIAVAANEDGSDSLYLAAGREVLRLRVADEEVLVDLQDD